MNMLWRFLRTALPILSCALLVGCAATPGQPERELEGVEWPAFSAPEPAETVFRVDSQASVVLIRVDPEGPMARLGHSHVIGGPVISGVVVTDGDVADARLDLTVNAAALEVDRPGWRRAQGLEPELDAGAIRGTRDNMRSERVLDVDRHPEIGIRSVAITGSDWIPLVTVRIRLRGQVREVSVPVAVVRTGKTIEAIGHLELFQSDFGIQPFSAAGGALRVSDKMRIRFRIVALNEQRSPD